MDRGVTDSETTAGGTPLSDLGDGNYNNEAFAIVLTTSGVNFDECLNRTSRKKLLTHRVSSFYLVSAIACLFNM